MLWSDLEVGDVLEYTDEYKEKILPKMKQYGINKKWFTKKEFEIIGLNYILDNTVLKLIIKGIKGEAVNLVIENGCDFDFYIDIGEYAMFKIKRLRRNND